MGYGCNFQKHGPLDAGPALRHPVVVGMRRCRVSEGPKNLRRLLSWAPEAGAS